MKFQYTHLEQDSIRVIRFSQYATSSFIHVWLEHLPDFAKDNAPYSVISYCPDEASPAEQRSITLNGRSFVVPSPLFDALSAIVEHHDRTAAYWTDAVSINHGDAVETQEQMAQTPRVFSCADDVLLWIGHEDEQIETAFSAIRAHAESCPYESLDLCNAGSKHCDDPSERDKMAVQLLAERVHPRRTTNGLDMLQMRNAILLCGKLRCEAAQFVHFQKTSSSPKEAVLGRSKPESAL
jgi:hypothetical protein